MSDHERLTDHEQMMLIKAVFTLRNVAARSRTETRELNRLAFRLAEVVHRSLQAEASDE